MKTSRRWAALARTVLVAVAIAALVIILTGPAGAARPYKAPAPEANAPQWVLPNIVAVLMSLGVLAIPCKRFRRT